MSKQNYELKSERIRSAFLELKRSQLTRLKRRLQFSWSNWGFGLEPLANSAARLERAGIRAIELLGNHYGPDPGYNVDETLRVLGDHGITVNRPIHRQAAIDYLKREIVFTAAVGGTYLLVVPGAVGRPKAYDDTEFERSVETLRSVAHLFVQHGVRAAVEPIRSAEVSLVHAVSDARRYIAAVGHPGVAYINGDAYHMQAEEAHIGEALLEAGDQLVNLHMADSNRRALSEGSLDLDTIIMALYLIGYNVEGRYITPEPLGPGGDPYPAMYGLPAEIQLERLARQTASYFREREEALLG